MARLLTACALAGALLTAQAAPDDPPSPLRKLEVQVDGRTLPEPLTLYQTDYQVLLPLAAVSRLLGLDTRVQAAHGRAAGTLPASGESFALDLADASMRVGERRVSFEPRLAQVVGDDLYVSTQLLSRWLKLEVAVDLPHWQLRLRAPAAGAVAAPPTPAPTAARRLDDSNLLVLEVQLDGMTLSDSLSAYQDGSQTLLPLGELARLLTLAIQVQPEHGSANGTLPGDKAFALDLAEAQARVGGREQGFEPRLAGVVGDDIYVSRRLLSHWLPVDLQLNLSALQLKVVPREKLPLQARLERERLAAALAGLSTADTRPNYPYTPTSPGLIGVPSIDQSFGADARFGRGSHQYKAAYTAYLTSDLLGMEGSAYVLKTRAKARPDLRMTLARHDPDAELLGPLRARSVAVGNLALPSVRNVMPGSASGNGVSVSNRPLDQPNSFDRHSLRGDLPPGWDVTLYYNDQLLGYQSSRADGQYAFDDLPLSFGSNEFRLVFHGPLGQLRVEKQSFMLDRASLKPGELYYTMASQLADDGSVRSVAQAELGLGKRLTGQLGLVRRPRLLPGSGAPRDYGQFGLLAYFDSLILSSQVVGLRGGGLLAELGLKTRLGRMAVDVLHTQSQGGFVNDQFAAGPGGVRQRDELRLQGGWRLFGLPRLVLDFNAVRSALNGGGSNNEVGLRSSAMLGGTAVSNSLRWQRSGDASSTDGALQLSRRMADIGLSAQLNYRLQPGAALQAVAVSADHALGDGYQLSAGLLRTLDTGLTLASAGFSKNLGSFGLALSASYSSQHELALGLQLFVALDRDPRSGRWNFDGQPLAGSGAVSARAFVDRNMNGIRDADEDFVPNAGFILNGGGRHPRVTGADGTALLNRLAPGRYADIALDPATLEDPQWKPLTPGVRVLPRPGRTEQLEFPVIVTSEVEGTVWLVEAGGRKRGIGAAQVELVDHDGQVVATTTSSADGYYLFHQVVPGLRKLRIAPEQAAKLKLRGRLERDLDVPANGDFLSGEDLVLKL